MWIRVNLLNNIFFPLAVYSICTTFVDGKLKIFWKTREPFAIEIEMNPQEAASRNSSERGSFSFLRLLHGIFLEFFCCRADSLCFQERSNLKYMDTKQTEISPSFHQRYILEVCRDCMKHSFLRQINACVCLDQYEGVGGLLRNGLFLTSVRRKKTPMNLCSD